MAKKRKKDKKEEEQEYEFKPPEFNEREFLLKELRDTRAAIVAVGIAVVFGVVAGVITALSSGLAVVAFIVGIAGMSFLKFLYNIMGIDISGFTKKNWAGTIVTYFFTFLAIWVLIINTPFVDLTDPSIEDVTVWIDDDVTLIGAVYKKSVDSPSFSWMRLDNNASPDNLIHTWNGYNINITARISDSGGIALAEIGFNGTTGEFLPMTKVESGRYEYSINGAELAGRTALEFNIHAKDKHGNEQTLIPKSISILA